MDLGEKIKELQRRQEELLRQANMLSVEIEQLRLQGTDGLPMAGNVEDGPIPIDMVDLDIVDFEPEPEIPQVEPEAPKVEVREAEVQEAEPDVPKAEIKNETQGPEDMPESLFAEEENPVTPKAKRSRSRKTAIVDAMAEKAAWRTDIPGPEVRSLRSAIALGDQVLFINRLFRKDSSLYQTTIDRLGEMSSLSEAINYLGDVFPEWNPESDDVYRFMMAVRRKIRK